MQFRSNEINNIVNAGRINELVKISEYKHQVQIENIVRIIASYNEYTKNIPITNGVFVTGPSSSGKTTTAKLIAKELEKNGYRSVHISLDDYYLTNEEICRLQSKPVGTPVDDLDMEAPSTINIKLFKEQINSLIAGKEITLPRYNFSNQGELKGDVIKATNDDVIIIEGIHALNPLITDALNFQQKILIYISPFDNFISPEGKPLLKPCDVRFMRRWVRDAAERNMTLMQELKMWPKVREGEEKYIKPMKKYANLFFDTSLQYEVPVLKYRMEMLIKELKPDEFELLKSIFPVEALDYFESVEKIELSEKSIFNEFYR